MFRANRGHYKAGEIGFQEGSEFGVIYTIHYPSMARQVGVYLVVARILEFTLGTEEET